MGRIMFSQEISQGISQGEFIPVDLLFTDPELCFIRFRPICPVDVLSPWVPKGGNMFTIRKTRFLAATSRLTATTKNDSVKCLSNNVYQFSYGSRGGFSGCFWVPNIPWWPGIEFPFMMASGEYEGLNWQYHMLMYHQGMLRQSALEHKYLLYSRGWATLGSPKTHLWASTYWEHSFWQCSARCMHGLCITSFPSHFADEEKRTHQKTDSGRLSDLP